ncbi:proton-conducting transporter membrane subunit [Flavobacterium sp. LS2P90]|uniref:Probable inorganic carbon transporter subunit DabB n=1 Tax=Flavobacterium xylosi TaxID=3230415 RepID=A0ABW6HXJ8_9FLAO
MIEVALCILFIIPMAMFLVAGIVPNKASNLILLTNLTRIASLLATIISLVGAVWLFNFGMIESGLFGIYDLGFLIRIDPLSLIMFSMISIIAIVVLRFSYNYLDGDSNQAKFISELALTIGLVQLLVLSGNIFGLFIAWVFTSLALNKLIVFYPNRKKARIAARKKFIVARLGDIFLLIALSLIYIEFGSGNLSVIFEELKQTQLHAVSLSLEVAAVLLVLTAALKSAQIPFHGWLIEVMEAPTPVSALLHAGLLNAGPFLMIRFAYLLDVVSIAPVFLFVLGAITALYGALVFTTQPNIKTSLAYSSVAHMGFSMMTCGLGLYAASLLHLVAHSFFKAHSFLSSGSMVEKVITKEASTYSRKGSVGRMIIGLAISIALFLLISSFWGVTTSSEYQLLIIGGVIFTGVMNLVVNAVDSGNYFRSILKIMGATVLVLMSFYGLEELTRLTLGAQIPPIAKPGKLMMFLSATMLMVFFTTVLIHLLSPILKKGTMYKNFGVHVRNGFYLNLLVDRITISNYKRF